MEETKEIIKIKSVKPFLRWTGSKRWLVKDKLEDFLPKSYNNYHECFLGGGSVFFSIDPKKRSYLYDTNEELIETYKEIRDNAELVIKRLKRFKNTEEEYYHVRKASYKKPHTRAARFIYLNRCSFNGIYRVNNKGIYNVPYGKRKNVDLVTEDSLIAVSDYLKNTKLLCNDFESSLNFLNAGDLVFLDPPYTVAHNENGFIEYNKKLFSWEDQKRLKAYIDKLNEKQVYFILTNASHESIEELYKNCGDMFKLSRYSHVGGRNKTRGMFEELIICNTLS